VAVTLFFPASLLLVVGAVEMETQPMVKMVALAVAVRQVMALLVHQAPVALEQRVKVLQVVLVSMCTQFGRKVAVVVVQVLLVLMALNLVEQAEMAGLVFQIQYLVLLFSMLVVVVVRV
jgi:hypothetical protein